MNRKTKRVMLIILGILVFILLSALVYYYIAFSGNPIDQFLERRAVLDFYESRYEEDFDVLRSSYDYKRREFSFRLAPKSKLNHAFTTTLGETNRVDRYGQVQATTYLETLIRDSINDDDENHEYQTSISEEYTSPGILEADLHQRLSLNSYRVTISWDTETIDESMVDQFLETTANTFKRSLNTPVGSILIHGRVYDGENYYFSEVMIEN